MPRLIDLTIPDLPSQTFPGNTTDWRAHVYIRPALEDKDGTQQFAVYSDIPGMLRCLGNFPEKEALQMFDTECARLEAGSHS